MQIREILDGLDLWDEEEVPVDLLLAAVDAEDEIIPDLILTIQQATKNPIKYIHEPDHQLNRYFRRFDRGFRQL